MSNLTKTAFVIAHFHEKGRVAKNTFNLLEEMAKKSDCIVFISTNLDEEEARRVRKHAFLIQRENSGYDFWSYKIGIDQLGDMSQFDRIVVCNTSFISIDPLFLVSSFTGIVEQVGLRGLTRCGEMSEHIQSYWISFEGKSLLNSPEFMQWWDGMLSLNDRKENIIHHEVGISTYFLNKGYPISTLFKETTGQLLIMLSRAISTGSIIVNIEDYSQTSESQIVPLDLKYAYGLNPTIYAWDFIIDQIKILKIEQFKYNYGRQFMDWKWPTLSDSVNELITDAIK